MQKGHDEKMDIYFNNYKLPNVISCQVKRLTRNTKTEYNAEGGMLIDMVNRKRTLTVHLGGLRASEMQRLFAITGSIFFTVTFNSPENPGSEMTTAEFHMREQVAETDYVWQGITYYKAMKLVLEER
ncbi:MAG: hypothetical protein FWE74_09650 [Oscillospiraceae bacterium]|nr:hypothetical protein [Oscillospiraceae bacterium]